jgi:hypothetical protein
MRLVWRELQLPQRRFAVDTATDRTLTVGGEEFATLTQLLEEARTKLLVEIRRTDHRRFREELSHRLIVVEKLLERCHPL